MITCIVVDDEPMAVNLLTNYIGQVQFLQLENRFYNAIDAFQFLKDHPVDLIFLDINMPRLSGMQFKSLLPSDQQVIFTTAYSQYAIESYEKNAVDYLMKPITFERFLQSVNKVKDLRKGYLAVQNAPSHDTIFIKTGKTIFQLRYTDLLYIEGLKDYVVLHTVAGKQVIYKRMKELETILPSQFSRIHLSFIINRKHIQKIEDNHIFIGSVRIPISDKYKESFIKIINQELL